MSYEYGFSKPSIEKKFEKALEKISNHRLQDKIMQAIESLKDNPRPFGTKAFKRLNPPIVFQELTASYRIRIGDYRILYDIDDKRRIVWLIALRKRSEKTYKK